MKYSPIEFSSLDSIIPVGRLNQKAGSDLLRGRLAVGSVSERLYRKAE